MINEQITREVQDLEGGTASIEERARYEMRMIKDGEVFVQLVSPNALECARSDRADNR